MHRFNAFSYPICASHTLSKNTNHKKFLSNMICYWTLIDKKKLSQFHTLLQPKVVFQELNPVLEILKFHI